MCRFRFTCRCTGLVVGVALLNAASLEARQASGERADSARLYPLEALVVTAERRAAALELSTSAVTVLDGDELRALPVRTLAEALRQAPGIAFVDFDGTGLDPQVMTRGFYGGGEAEHVMLLVDGRPLNALESGRAPWDLIPLSSVESIEVVRGSGSAPWGDAAMGGVINVITRRDGESSGRVSLAGGQHGVARGSASLSGEWSGMPGSVFASASTADGWRDHARRRTGAFGATLGVIDTPARRLELSTLNDWRRYDEPGPLIGRTLFDRAESSPFYRFDEVEERYHRVAIDGRFAAGATSTLVASLTGDYRHSDRVRTVPLAPAFADTKARVLSTARLIGSTQLELDGPLPGDDALMIGADASVGHIESRYHDFMMGSPEVYAAADASRGDVVASGAGWRNAAAGFLGYTVDITPAVRFTTGARVDWLRDSFDEDDAQEAAEDHSTSHVAFSPRAGLNVQYLDRARQHGRVYFTIARSFKAPTPDQLYDQRTFPVDFPPFQIGFANDQLDPQYATSYEAGVYHHADIVPGALAAELTLSAYHMDIRDEIDFDIASFGYQNIGRSRHRGIEAGLDLRGVRPYSAFVRYALQAVTSRVDGENFGNALKAIPRHFIVAGARAGHEDAGPAVSLTATTARRIWLDDANTMRLPDWTRWDTRVSWAVAGLTVHADVYNLFDAEYSTAGFPDSADPTTTHYYPAAGRTLYVGLSRSWP